MKQSEYYKEHKKKINQTIDQFLSWGFKKTVDKNSSLCTGSDIYYKQIEENKYLIFCHYNPETKKDIDGFDCYLAEFRSESGIGLTKPIREKDLKLTFHLDQHFHLIKQYINNMTHNHETIDSIFREYKEKYPKLTDHQALELAVQIQRNQILKAAFVVTKISKHPAALESIAMSLGQN